MHLSKSFTGVVTALCLTILTSVLAIPSPSMTNLTNTSDLAPRKHKDDCYTGFRRCKEVQKNIQNLISEQRDQQVHLNKLLKQATAQLKDCTHQEKRQSGIPIVGPAIDAVEGVVSELHEALFHPPRNCSNIDRCMNEVDTIRVTHHMQVGKTQEARRNVEFATGLNGQCMDQELDSPEEIIIIPRSEKDQDHDLVAQVANCNALKIEAQNSEKTAQTAYDDALEELNAGRGMPYPKPKHSARNQPLDSPGAALPMSPVQRPRVKPETNVDNKAILENCKADTITALENAKRFDRQRNDKYIDRIDPRIYFKPPKDIDALFPIELDNSTESKAKPSGARMTKRGDEEHRVHLGQEYYAWLGGTLASQLQKDLVQCRDDKWVVLQKFWHKFYDAKVDYNKLVGVIHSLKSEASSATKTSTWVSTFTTTSVKTTTITASASLCTITQSANDAAPVPSASSSEPSSSTSAPASTTSLVIKLFDTASASIKLAAASSPKKVPASSSLQAVVTVTAAQSSTKADEPATVTVTAKGSSSPSTSGVSAGPSVITVPASVVTLSPSLKKVKSTTPSLSKAKTSADPKTVTVTN